MIVWEGFGMVMLFYIFNFCWAFLALYFHFCCKGYSVTTFFGKKEEFSCWISFVYVFEINLMCWEIANLSTFGSLGLYILFTYFYFILFCLGGLELTRFRPSRSGNWCPLPAEIQLSMVYRFFFEMLSYLFSIE